MPYLQRKTQSGFLRQSILLGTFWSLGSTSVLAQVVHTAPGGELAGIMTSTGIQGLLIFFLVQSMRREIEQAKTYAADLKEVSAESARQNERLLTAVIERVPAAEKGKKS